MSRFDKISFEYKEILGEDIKAFGEPAEYFADYKARYVKDFLGAGFRGNILDFGCGIGMVAGALRKYFDPERVRITGYDESSKSVRRCMESVKNAVFTDDLASLEKKAFDVVVLANVLHHVPPPARTEFLRNVAALAKKGGSVMVFEHNPRNPLTRRVVSRSRIDAGVVLIDARECSDRLRGYAEIIKVGYIVFFPFFLRSLRRFERFMGSLPIGAQYAMIGRIQ